MKNMEIDSPTRFERIKKLFSYLKQIVSSRRAQLFFWFPFFVILIIFLLRFYLLPWLYTQSWSGMKASNVQKDFREKTLWDWMELLLVPAILIWGAWFLNRAERKSEQMIAGERLQETALLSYLDKMTELILDKGLTFTENKENRIINDIARARTLTVLQGLDGTRKAMVIEFLSRSNLIDSNLALIDLYGADLRKIQLQNNVLGSMRLVGVNMENANLSNSVIDNNDFSHANLRNANLTKSHVIRLNLLTVTGQPGNVIISQETLDSFRKPEYTVNFSDADLSGANLENSSLFRANFSNANLQGTILRDAELAGVNLSRSNITDDQLKECRCLLGARLPGFGLYDGRFNLHYDIYLAKTNGVNVNSSTEMKKWYSGTYFKNRTNSGG